MKNRSWDEWELGVVVVGMPVVMGLGKTPSLAAEKIEGRNDTDSVLATDHSWPTPAMEIPSSILCTSPFMTAESLPPTAPKTTLTLPVYSQRAWATVSRAAGPLTGAHHDPTIATRLLPPRQRRLLLL
jgi:hypothetical protein